MRLIQVVLVTMLSVGCASGPRRDPNSPLHRVTIDGEGNHYVIDSATRLCVLVLAEASQPVRVPCRLLRRNVSKAAPFITWRMGPDTERVGASLGEGIERRVGRRALRKQIATRKHRDGVTEGVDVTVVKRPDGSYEVERKSLENILANRATLRRGARAVTYIKNHTAVGFKLFAIRPSSMAAMLGLKNGDAVLAVNGTRLTSMASVLDAHLKLRSASRIELDVVRRSGPMKLVWHIVEESKNDKVHDPFDAAQ